MKQAHFMTGVAVTALIIIPGVIMALNFMAAARLSSQPPAQSFGQPIEPVEPVPRPQSEELFIEAKIAAASSYDAAINDIIKKQAMDRWQASVCNIMPSPNFEEWTGHVSAILSGGGFIVDLGDGVLIEGDAEAGSSVFQSISQLREGQSVIVSGSFEPDGYDPKCKVDLIANPFSDDAIKKPDFKVDFVAVSPG